MCGRSYPVLLSGSGSCFPSLLLQFGIISSRGYYSLYRVSNSTHNDPFPRLSPAAVAARKPGTNFRTVYYSLLKARSMKKNFPFIATFVIGFAAGIFLVSLLSFDEKHSAAIPCGTQANTNQPIWPAPALPSSIDFAGEAVPLDQFEIKEALDREVLYNYYNQNSILYLLKLANRYFPAIEERLKANGVPDDFKYLCVAESQLAN